MHYLHHQRPSPQLYLVLFLYLTIFAPCAKAEIISQPTYSSSNFSVPNPKTSLEILNGPFVLPSFYPLFQEKLSPSEFEQTQSIIIPGGIVDTANKVVYLENGGNNVLVLDLASGDTIKQINNICTPIAIVDDSLIALAKKTRQAKSSYDLLVIDTASPRNKIRWRNPILLPDWLDLPADGERQKFIFSVHCYNSIFSITWQASNQAMFPNALSWIAPYIANAVQGSFCCHLKLHSVISESLEQSNDDFSNYLTTDEGNIPGQIALTEDTIAVRKYDPYVFVLVRTFPPEHNISKAGVVAKRELQLRDTTTGKMIWSHTLPAAFIPLSF